MAAKYHNAFCIHLLFAFSLGPLCSVITLVHYNGISATERSTSNSTQFVQQTNAINKQMLCKANEDRWIQKRTHVDIRIQTIVILIVLLCWYPFCHISQQQPVQCMEKHHQLSACLFVQRFAAKKQYNDVKAVMITSLHFSFLFGKVISLLCKSCFPNICLFPLLFCNETSLCGTFREAGLAGEWKYLQAFRPGWQILWEHAYKSFTF